MFDRIRVPVPFEMGRVNTYVAGTTVVDPGPDSEEAWDALVDGLADCGRSPADIEQVLITHAHLDHFGLASRLREYGATVVASPEAARICRDFAGHLDRQQAFFTPFLQQCGLSAEMARTVVQLPEAFVEYAPPVETDVELQAGETVTVDGTTLDVDSLTGHAIGELLFAFDAGDERRAIVGDHVLGHITPNPFLQPPPPDSDERPRVLPAFNRSLDRLETAGYGTLLPGHGDAIEDPTGRIQVIREDHENRTEAVLDLLDEPRTPTEIMHGLFEDLPATEMFLGLSEAVGHLDVLEARDRVERTERDGVFVYEQVD
jgi:glyoxylase-like metal-dependent hydrolase (beta-lactamase superfamily II)